MKNGFADLKKSDRHLYDEIKSHLSTIIDPHDWGYLHNNGRSKPRANYKEDLNFWLSSSIPKQQKKAQEQFYRKIRALSLKRIDNHCSGSETYYVCSAPWTGFALILHDIDDKDGRCGDSDEVLEVIKQFFPDAFTQVSTFGKGRHAFSFIDYKDMGVHRFRALCRLLEGVIGKHLKSLGLKSTYEVQGVPGLRNPDNTYKTCGLLAKFPRLASPEQWRDYLGRRIVPVSEVVEVLKTVDPDINLNMKSGDEKDQKPHSERKNSVRITVSEERERRERSIDGKPVTRMNRCGWELSKRIGRAATGTEILSEYQRQKLHTGTDDDGNRAKLADDSAKWCSDHYDPHKRSSINYNDNLKLIEQFVTDEVKKIVYARNRRKYTNNELAAVLSIIEKESTRVHQQPKLQFTTPNNSFIALFKKLNIEVEEGTTQLDKLRAMKSALVEANLAEVVDDKWDIGRGKRFGLGKNHPRYDDFVKIKQALQPSTIFNDEVLPCSTSTMKRPRKTVKPPKVTPEPMWDSDFDIAA
jgi:hypothetical protein